MAQDPPEGPYLAQRLFGPAWLPTPLRRNLPALVLVGFAIAIPEFLTGSTPVLAVFLDPLSLLFLIGLYGCGALLIRETSMRWGKGWPTVLLLGGAYGIVEEGFGTTTFFMSPSSAAGSLSVFGHAWGVNWVWVVDISVFHAIFSIGLPILLVGLIFPSTQAKPLVRGRSVLALLAAYLVTAVAMFVLFNPMDTPSTPLLVLFAAAVGMLVGLARLAPSRLDLPLGTGGLRSPVFVGVVGGLFVWLTFGTYWLLPSVVPSPVAVVGAAGFLALVFGVLVVREFESGSPSHRLALAAGLLSFLFLLSVAVGLSGDALAMVVSGVIIYALVWTRRRIRAADVRPPPGAAWGLG